MKPLVLVTVLVLVLVLALSACNSRSESCTKVTQALDPIAKDLDRLAAEAATPSPADQTSCTRLADEILRIESAEAKLAVVITKDETLAKHLDAYRGHVAQWAKAMKNAQASCLMRDGNKMTAGLSQAIEVRAQLPSVKNDITTYCKAP